MTDRPGAYGVLTGSVLLLAGGVIFNDPPLAIIGCLFAIIPAVYLLIVE
jgi:hypothetical protein